MKNKEVIYLVDKGILGITGHSLTAEEYYRLIKLKRWLEEKYHAIGESQSNMMQELGLEITDLAKKEKLDLLTKFSELNNVMLDEDIDIPGEFCFGMDRYKAIYDENNFERDGKRIDILSNYEVEKILLNNIFTE